MGPRDVRDITVTLSAECAGVLMRLATTGGRIEARRTYPHPHHYHLAKPDGWRYAGRLAALTVTDLLKHGLIAAAHDEAERDRIDYTITEAGRDAALRGGVVLLEVVEEGDLFGPLESAGGAA